MHSRAGYRISPNDMRAHLQGQVKKIESLHETMEHTKKKILLPLKQKSYYHNYCTYTLERRGKKSTLLTPTRDPFIFFYICLCGHSSVFKKLQVIWVGSLSMSDANCDNVSFLFFLEIHAQSTYL